jgi:hypothetical protein
VFHAQSHKRKPLARSFPLLSLFFQEIISDRQLVRAEILGFRWLDDRKNSETTRCFSLFPAVLVAQIGYLQFGPA